MLRYQALISDARLAEMDEARDSGVVASHDWLSGELRRLRAFIVANGVVRIGVEGHPVILQTDEAFVEWVQSRYPDANLSEPGRPG
jgi:hypothetical protein